MTDENELALVVTASAYDKDDPRSLQALLPVDSLLPDRVTELADEINIGRTDESFRNLLRDHKHYKTARRLRLQFWNLYNMAAGHKIPKKIPVSNIYSGVVSSQTFKNIMREDKLAAFIFTQPHRVRLIQEDLLYEGYRNLEEIMDMDIHKADGSVDPRVVGHKLKIIQMLEDRINGSVVQRVHQHVEQASKFEGNLHESPEDLEKMRLEIANLKKNLGKDIDVAEYTEIK